MKVLVHQLAGRYGNSRHDEGKRIIKTPLHDVTSIVPQKTIAASYKDDEFYIISNSGGQRWEAVIKIEVWP